MLEKEDCMQALSGQIFMGMVSSQYQARLDIVRLIDGLVNACIRFVYFSLEDELKSKVGRAAAGPGSPGCWAHLFTALCFLQVFAEKMGLETGWNCHISLTPNGDMPGSEMPPSSPSHAGSLHDDLNQGEGKGWWWGPGGCGPLLGASYARKSPVEPSRYIPLETAPISPLAGGSVPPAGQGKAPRRLASKVRDRLLSPQCPEMMQKGSC